MPQQSFYLVLLTPDSDSNTPIPDPFLRKLAVSFPAAQIIQFCADIPSMKALFAKYNIPEAARIIVQPLYVVGGAEYLNLLEMFTESGAGFVRVGLPLLGVDTGVRKLAAGFLKEQEKNLNNDCAVVFVGHGSRMDKAETMYEKLGEYLHRLHPNLHALSLRSDFDTIVCRLSKVKNILLVPLLIHSEGSTWQKISGRGSDCLCFRIEQKGFNCSVYTKGLLESEAAQSVWLDNIRLALNEM